MEPYTYHLHLHPSHLTLPAPNHSRTSSSSSSSAPYSTTRPPSPYTPHILTLLVVSFPFLAFIISLPSFPVRGVCLHGRSVCPSRTYHINGMEADRRADMESIVILSRFPLEIVVCEDKVAGGKEERGGILKYWRRPFRR